MAAAIIVGALMLTGCTTVQYPDAIITGQRDKGVYHVVQKGETLWSIAQSYKVDLREIAWANKISNSAVIRRGQRLFIPGASTTLGTDVIKPDLDTKKFAWPLQGRILTYFQGRGAGFWNQGIRIQATPDQKVLAARAGEVVFSDSLMGYGYTVIVDHQDGYLSVYANNGRGLVDLGRKVNKGDAVAQVSGSGDCFLYFEIRRKGVAENPLFYLPKI